MKSFKLGRDLLKLEEISLDFGPKKILRNVNITIKDIVGENSDIGQIITLLGRSGVGKTQLFKIIAGLQKPTTGEVLIPSNKRPDTPLVTHMEPVEPGKVGMVLQTYPLFPHRTLMSNLELVSDDASKIKEYLEYFDIYDCRHRYPKQLSGGQRQRGAIVQQLLCSEHFVLLDEPFSGLDPVATEKLCGTISKVAHTNNMTVIISSHILEPALAISDSIYILGYHDDPANPGGRLPGATVRFHYNLASIGLAWDPHIRRNPAFTKLVEDIRAIFLTL